jgi:hypothetical protein
MVAAKLVQPGDLVGFDGANSAHSAGLATPDLPM